MPATQSAEPSDPLHCRSPFICASSTSITWERTASRRRPSFSHLHLVTSTIPDRLDFVPHYDGVYEVECGYMCCITQTLSR